MTSMFALCDRSEELYAALGGPAPARCHFCPLFHALGGRREDLGCRSVLDPIIDLVRAGALEAARTKIGDLTRMIAEMSLPEEGQVRGSLFPLMGAEASNPREEPEEGEDHAPGADQDWCARLRRLASELPWAPNVWMGVSVEDASVLQRVNDLREVPAAIRFLSCEPLIGSLTGLNLELIHWVIVGGESGPNSRPMEEAWVLDIRDRCIAGEVAFFFKQWGGVRKHLTGRTLQGQEYNGFPVPAEQLPVFQPEDPFPVLQA